MITPNKSTDAALRQLNLAQLSYLPGITAKRGLLVAEAAAAAAMDTLPHWCVDDLTQNDLFVLENGVWSSGNCHIRLPPGKESVITIVPPITAKKLVFVYLDDKCGDDMTLAVGIDGEDPEEVGFNRIDAFGHPNYWVSDLVTGAAAGDVEIVVTYHKEDSGKFDYFLGYGLAWSET